MPETRKILQTVDWFKKLEKIVLKDMNSEDEEKQSMKKVGWLSFLKKVVCKRTGNSSFFVAIFRNTY